MEINYKQELFNLLEKNEIKVLPSQDLINSDIRFALAIWKNYAPDLNLARYEYEDMSAEDYYKALNWGTTLESYKENINFWTQAFELTKNYKILLTNEFEQDFKFIAEKWLNDNSKLIELFENTQNKDFLKLVKGDEKETIYKNFLIKNISHATKEDIERYQEDAVFVTKLLTIKPFNYKILNDCNKLKHEYVKLALKNKDMWGEIPEKFQKEPTIRAYWFNLNINSIQLSDIDNLKDEEKAKYFENRPNALNLALNKDYSKYKEIAIKFLEVDLQKHISAIPANFLDSDIKKELSTNNIIKKNLIDFINNYKKIDKISNKEEKLFSLIRSNKEIKEIASNNFFYMLQNQKLKNKKINQEEFDGWIKKIIRDVNSTSEDSNKLIGLLKSFTSIEILKLLPKTKDLLIYYRHEDLTEKLENEKSPELKKITKIKI